MSTSGLGTILFTGLVGSTDLIIQVGDEAVEHLDWAQTLAERGESDRAREQAEISIALGEQLGSSGEFGIAARARSVFDGL